VTNLYFCRFPDAGDEANAIANLGGRWVGNNPQAIQAPLLWPETTAVFDGLLVVDTPQAHQHGCVRYVTNGDWLHGEAHIDDSAVGMHTAAQALYADVFDVLASQPCSHLLRVWNYFADMNVEAQGLERYRQFNAGRQQAFLDAQHSAFEGAPAACALGTSGGSLRVYFLAGRAVPQVIENPRQVSAYHYPEDYGPRSPGFSRAALVNLGAGRQALLISGTASIVGHATMHVGDVRLQTQESLRNIAVVLEAATQRAGVAFAADELTYTLYLRDRGDLPVVREVFEGAVGATSPAARTAVYLQADVCRADLLVEIEAHGFASKND
jgi:chorismate lyase / 3-hydroxybenzoate synthase